MRIQAFRDASLCRWVIPDVSGEPRCLRLWESASSILATTARLLNAKAPRHSETSGITPSQPERLESFATPLHEPRISHGNYHLHHVRLFTFQIHFENCLPLFIPSVYLLTEKPGSSGEHFWHVFGRCLVRMSATTVTSWGFVAVSLSHSSQISGYFLKLVHNCFLSHPFWSLSTVTSPFGVAQSSVTITTQGTWGCIDCLTNSKF